MSLFAARNEIRWSPAEGGLPMSCVQRGSRVGGIAVSFFGLAWCGFLLASIVMGTLREGANVPMTLLLLAFALPGVGFVYLGLAQLRGQREIRIDSEWVRVRDRGVRNVVEWSEPISAYAGVLRRSIAHSGGHGGSSWTEWLVVLAHGDAEREIRLFESRAGSGAPGLQQECWRRMGALLGAPLLEQDAEGVVVRDAASYDAPLRERLAASSRDNASPTAGLGPRVGVAQEGLDTVFQYRRLWSAWRPGLAAAVCCALLYAARHIAAGDPDPSGIELFYWVIGGFLALFALAFLGELVGVEELRVGPDRVVHRLRRGLGTSEGSIALEAIREIAVRSDPRRPNGPRALVIAGPGAELRFGAPLPETTLIAMKARAIALLAREARSGTGAPAARPVAVGDPMRSARPRLAWMAVASLAFLALLAGLMHLAFDGREPDAHSPVSRHGEAGKASRESRTTRRLDTARNRLILSWQSHYEAGQKAALEGDYALAERELHAALAYAQQLGSGEPMLDSTLGYLDWVDERRSQHQGAQASSR